MIDSSLPEASSNPVRATRYYCLDSRKLTYGEYWNILRSWQVIVPWTAKLLNLPMKFSSGMPYFESVRELRVPENEFPSDAADGLQALREKCEALGFHSAQFHNYMSMGRETRTSFIAMLHPSGATLRLMYTIASNVHPPKVKFLVVLLSELNDGTFYFTSDQKPQFLTPPGVVANRLPGATPEQVVESHLQKLEEFNIRNPARPVESIEALDDVWDRYETLSREFGMKRGVYVWMKPEEVNAHETQMAEAKTMAGATTENLEVLLELNKLQTKKTGWGNVILILIVSLAMFIGTGSRQWSWNYVLMIVPVLFIHELGHYLAMRAFNYRNLRMFFIPFFGAAVSGQHYNVAGWKKVIVSLMGPVPGIFLGVIVGVAGMILHKTLLMKIATLTLILNGFNLLPILPLDGGWVFHTLLFSRHQLLDAVFRVVAAIALAAIGIFSHVKVLMYLSIPMFMGIPVAYRLARIAANLRERGIAPAANDSETIPAETAQAIIGELKQSNTKAKLQSTKMLAQQTLQIFETLNARPPGWAASIGLLFAHGVSLGLAVVFACVFVYGQRQFGSGLTFSSTMTKRPLKCGASHIWSGAQASELMDGEQNTIVANFAGGDQTEKAFQSLTNRLPAVASVKTFGQSLLLVLPADGNAERKTFLAELERQTKDVFVDNTNSPTSVSLSCVAPDAQIAERITAELEGYFSTMRGQSLVPPWLPEDSRAASERAEHALARQTYITLQKAEYDGYTNSALKDLEKRVFAANRRGDTAEAKALVEEKTALMKTLRMTSMERVRKGEDGPIDITLANLFIAASADDLKTNVHAQLVQDMARRMGQLPFTNGVASAAEDRFTASSGMVNRDKLRVEIMFVTFRRVADGAPALADWLCSKGCTDLKYGFRGDSGADDSLDRD